MDSGLGGLASCLGNMGGAVALRYTAKQADVGMDFMTARLSAIFLSALTVIVSQARAGDLHCKGVFTEQRKVGLSLGNCDLTKISPDDFEKIVGICGEPTGVDEDANKTTCNVVGVGARNVVKRILSVRRAPS